MSEAVGNPGTPARSKGIVYNSLKGKSYHCKCDGCKLEQLAQDGWKCFKCPKGILRRV